MFKKAIYFILVLSFSFTCITPYSNCFAQSALGLPEAGSLVSLSPSFRPALLRGLVVHPENPMRFDFILDNGEERFDAMEQKAMAQRSVNYFLAALAVPEKDLWVNLSPIEKDRIIPDALAKTELGRDLLVEDYMLKQIASSLMYPEKGLGKEFWQRVYAQAYEKFGVTQIPVDTFNKVWIVPQDAAVIEKQNTVYVTNMHLKVMLDDDYQTQKAFAKKDASVVEQQKLSALSKQVMREVIIPALEVEVNEGKNFAQLRQISYALTLAQWYQDVFKQSVINKVYASQSKVAGIDSNDPKNKEVIYQQYLQAYKKGVFNFIKEETDHLSKTPIPRKYFSGGFSNQHIRRQNVSLVMASATEEPREHYVVAVDMAMAQEIQKEYEPISYAKWNDLSFPFEIKRRLENLFVKGDLVQDKWRVLISDYAKQVQESVLYPVQSSWPVLKAIVLMTRKQEQQIIQAIEDEYSPNEIKRRPRLLDAILLMNNRFNSKLWLKQQAPHLEGRMVYLTAAEIHHWAGGLGPVMKFLGKGMKSLGAQVSFIEPWYQYRRDILDIKGNPTKLDYHEMGLTDIDENFVTFRDVKIGIESGTSVSGLETEANDKVTVKIVVAKGLDQNGVPVYLFKDELPDGSSYFTKMLYNYDDPVHNPISKQRSMAFIVTATSILHEYLEQQRMSTQKENWKPSIIHSNDGQFAPLQAKIMSRDDFSTNQAIKNTFFAYTTHTYANRGDNAIDWGLEVFAKHMMGIKPKFLNVFRRVGKMDHTSAGVNLADVGGAVSDMHRDNVNPYDPRASLTALSNGADPEEMGKIFRNEFRILFPKGDVDRPTGHQIARTKIETRKYFNSIGVRSASNRLIEIDMDALMIGNARRGVPEKDGARTAFVFDNIERMVKRGVNLVLMNNYQGKVSDASREHFMGVEEEIWRLKKENPTKYPGKFYFVDKFTADQKVALLGATNVKVMPSIKGTGANEFTEEDPFSNGSLQAGTNEGNIVTGGLVPGQTFVPEEDTDSSWWNTVFQPIINLWEEDQGHNEFYKQAALSPRLIRIMHYLNTSAANLEAYDKEIERQENNNLKDQKDINNIIASVVKQGGADVRAVLFDDRDQDNRSFRFSVVGQGDFQAPQKGLVGFIEEASRLEEMYGYDAFLGHHQNGHFRSYLLKLFTGQSAQVMVASKFDEIRDERVSELAKYKRSNRFMEQLKDELMKALQVVSTSDSAMLKGGIDLSKRIFINKEGYFEAVDMVDGALERVLQGLSGLQGKIINIVPIENLQQVIR